MVLLPMDEQNKIRIKTSYIKLKFVIPKIF